MVTKLNTEVQLDPTPVVNVKGQKGSFFKGLLLTRKAIISPYKNEKGENRDFQVYTFELGDTDMSTVVKKGTEYIECDVKKGDLVCVFAPTKLHRALSQAPDGSVLTITYLGLGKAVKGKGKPHDYEVVME